MSKHTATPGPWHVHEIAPEDPDWQAFEIWNTKASKMIANGAGSASMRVFGLANARLASAAPDLLAALEEAKRELEAYENERTGELYNSLMINAAIAKAKGEA